MRSLRLSFPRAYCFVRARRLNVIIQPHLRFAYELLKWEEVLRREAAAAADGKECDGVDGCGCDGVEEGKGEREEEGCCVRELEWAEIAREIALMNRPYAR